MLWNDRGEWTGGFTQYPDYENRESRDLEDAIAKMHRRESMALSKPEPAMTLKINVYDVTEDVFFHIGTASADYKGEPMELSAAMDASPVFSFRGKRYMFKVEDLGLALWEKVTKDG